MWKCRFERVEHMLLHVFDILRRILDLGREWHQNGVVLEQRKHVGQYLRVKREASYVRRVGDHREYMLHDFDVVGLVEALRGFLVLAYILQEFEQYFETDLGYITHRMLECPYNGVEDELELGSLYQVNKNELHMK